MQALLLLLYPRPSPLPSSQISEMRRTRGPRTQSQSQIDAPWIAFGGFLSFQAYACYVCLVPVLLQCLSTTHAGDQRFQEGASHLVQFTSKKKNKSGA